MMEGFRAVRVHWFQGRQYLYSLWLDWSGSPGIMEGTIMDNGFSSSHLNDFTGGSGIGLYPYLKVNHAFYEKSLPLGRLHILRFAIFLIQFSSTVITFGWRKVGTIVDRLLCRITHSSYDTRQVHLVSYGRIHPSNTFFLTFQKSIQFSISFSL